MKQQSKKIRKDTHEIRLTGRDGTACTLSYTLSRSSARRSWQLVIDENADLTLHVPYSTTQSQAEDILREKTDWILKNTGIQLEKKAQRPDLGLSEKQREDAIRRIEKQLLPILKESIERYEPMLPASHRKITKISIRSQKTRWGSCSTRGTLSFNWKLYLAPRQVLDYVVVHELCHLCEMNHSERFWTLVSSIMPDYRVCRDWLRDNGNRLDL